MIAVEVRDPRQHVGEGRQAVARFPGEVGAAEERPLAVVGEEHGERPAAAALGEHLVRDLIDAVDVGALLAIDLDVHEALVEQPRGGLVLETFVGRDVAPMAGGVTDAEMNGLALAAGTFERLASPRVPLDRIVRVLPKVRTGFGHQMVGVLRRAVGIEMSNVHRFWDSGRGRAQGVSGAAPSERSCAFSRGSSVYLNRSQSASVCSSSARCRA
jgi:hypothetical protein